MTSNLQTGDFLIAILKTQNAKASEYALKSIHDTVSYLWTYYIDSVEVIKETILNFPDLLQLGSFCLSKIYFYANDHKSALEWVVHSSQLLDIRERSLYTDTIISLVFNNYIAAKNRPKANQEDDPATHTLPEVLAKQEAIILRVLESSINFKTDFDKKIIVGLTIETQNVHLLNKLLDNLSNEDLSKAFDFSLAIFETKSHCWQVYKSFLEQFLIRPEKDFVAISRCFFSLGMFEKHADMLAEMLTQQKLELCYQIASDLNESGSLFYCHKLIATLQNKIGNNAKELLSILSGEFKRKAQQLFLTQNSNVDVPFLRTILSKWKAKESYISSGIALSIGILLSSTQSIVHLKEFQKSFATLKNWSLFSAAASLGLIFTNRTGFIGESKELTWKENSPFCAGGLLYATGLSNFGNTLNEDLRVANLKNMKSPEEPIQHGAILALGLQNALSNDELLIEELKAVLFSEKAVQGEAAGYALNLVKATHYSKDYVEEMINLCQNNPHDKIARAAIGTIGLTAINSNADISNEYNLMIVHKDPHIRLGAVGLLSLRYFATGDSGTINELLKLAATDLSNDVRRMAVIGLAFVLIKKRPRAFLLLKMLSTSYNAYIRHAVALSLGILYSHSFDKKVTKLLLKMVEDKTDFVRQAASIGLGLIFQLGSESLDVNFEIVKNLLTEKLTKKYETGISKFGYILGLALLQPGGENCVVNLNRNENWNSSYVKPQALIGVFMFSFYFYWYPMAMFLGLSLEPTCLIGCTANLKVPKGFQFLSKAPKKYFDYYKTPENVEEKKNEAAPTVLSTTKRVKARVEKADQKGKTEATAKGMIIEEVKNEAGNIVLEVKVDDKKCLLVNPQRILRKQISFIDFSVENKRYEPIVENRKIGILFLKDLKEGTHEEYADDQPKEAWMVPPPEFKFENIPKK